VTFHPNEQVLRTRTNSNFAQHDILCRTRHDVHQGKDLIILAIILSPITCSRIPASGIRPSNMSCFLDTIKLTTEARGILESVETSTKPGSSWHLLEHLRPIKHPSLHKSELTHTSHPATINTDDFVFQTDHREPQNSSPCSGDGLLFRRNNSSSEASHTC